MVRSLAVMLAVGLIAPLVAGGLVQRAGSNVSQACYMCWEQGQAASHSPECSRLPLFEQAANECLCTGANINIIAGCHSQCVDDPDRQPQTVCAAVSATSLDERAVGYAAADAQECEICREHAQAASHKPACSRLSPEATMKCLCTAGNSDIISGCDTQCAGIPKNQPKSVCADIHTLEATPAVPVANSTIERDANDKKTCEICWEQAQASTHTPPCTGLSDKALHPCLCESGNFKIFSECNSQCVAFPKKQPKNVCHKLKTETVFPISQATPQITPATFLTLIPSAHIADTSYSSRRSLGGWWGSCGPIGNACKDSAECKGPGLSNCLSLLPPSLSAIEKAADTDDKASTSAIVSTGAAAQSTQ